MVETRHSLGRDRHGKELEALLRELDVALPGSCVLPSLMRLVSAGASLGRDQQCKELEAPLRKLNAAPARFPDRHTGVPAFAPGQTEPNRVTSCTALFVRPAVSCCPHALTRRRVRVVARPPAAAPATASFAIHQREVQQVVEAALAD